MSIDKHTAMKKLSAIIMATILFATYAKAQQDAQYTQFMFNKMAINPGYAGNYDATSITALQRNQWSGFKGAPSSQSITVNASLLSNKVGVGLVIQHDKIGASDSWNIGAAYAYKVKLSKGLLSIGIQAALRRHQVDWTALSPAESDDPLMMDDSNIKLAPSFGAGLYYQQSKFYAGISVPNVNQYRLSSIDQNNLVSSSIQQRHYYFMAGGLLYSRDKLKLKVAGLMKYTANAPVDIDLHTSLIFFDKLWTGVTLRHGGFQSNNNVLESADLVVQYQFSDGLRVGLAYDFSLTEINNYTSGTYEMMAFFQPFIKKDTVQNPRFF